MSWVQLAHTCRCSSCYPSLWTCRGLHEGTREGPPSLEALRSTQKRSQRDQPLSTDWQPCEFVPNYRNIQQPIHTCPASRRLERRQPSLLKRRSTGLHASSCLSGWRELQLVASFPLRPLLEPWLHACTPFSHASSRNWSCQYTLLSSVQPDLEDWLHRRQIRKPHNEWLAGCLQNCGSTRSQPGKIWPWTAWSPAGAISIMTQLD